MFRSILSRFNAKGSSCLQAYLVVFLVLKSSVLLWGSESDVRLEYSCVEPSPLPTEENNAPVIMLHGVTDVKETWNGLYKNVSFIAHRKVCIYDARNHGDSSWSDKFTLDVLAEDLGNFMNMMNIERAALVGHSMGGLTAIKFALDNPNKVEGLFVEDIGLEVDDNMITYVSFVVRLLRSSLSRIPDGADEPTARKAVSNYLQRISRGRLPASYIENMPLHNRNGTWQWKTNFEDMVNASEHVESYRPKLEGQYEGKVVFIYAKSSFFRVDEQKEDIRKLFPNVKLVAVEGYDHFLHFDHPEFMKELLDFLE